MSHTSDIASRLTVAARQVEAATDLLDAGNTLPFIARYRKEVTGGLDEEQISQIIELLAFFRGLDQRRETILSSIEAQGILSDGLKQQILAAKTQTELEDLYQPYKPKRRTRGSVAREKGLEDLANIILRQPLNKQSLDEIARPYLNADVPNTDDAYAGARDIIAETISDHPEVRRITREKALRFGILSAEKSPKAEDPRLVYEVYYQFTCRVDALKPHQVLAMDRGETEKVLRVHLEIAEQDWRSAVGTFFKPNDHSPLCQQLQQAIDDSAERLLLPAIERDIRRGLTEKAGEHAIGVFASNLRGLLRQSPLTGRVVMGIDPGFRTGCKAAVVDPTGKVLDTATIYPHEPQKQWDKSIQTLRTMIESHRVTLISSGNGTASRETEQLIAETIQKYPEVKYMITNEAGASVYSASPLARAELPGMDVSMRGAVSIARRVQDPLAELVKIDPKSIGIGLYQHDVDQKKLGEALAGVVEIVVNQVGVDVNTASPSLLTYVAGIGPKLADSMVAYRDEHGAFRSRSDLRNVSGLGPKAFEQSAGFLRIREGDQPLDASAIHPESYPAAEVLLKLAEITLHDPPEKRKLALDRLTRQIKPVELAQKMGCGIPTLNDILEQILRPGRDPRKDMPGPILRSDVLSMEDLTVGMILKGTVRNVVDFGAFVDIGVKHDGLLHRSQIPTGTQLEVGQIISVKILNVEKDRGRISLGFEKISSI
jgi:protein Tex